MGCLFDHSGDEPGHFIQTWPAGMNLVLFNPSFLEKSHKVPRLLGPNDPDNNHHGKSPTIKGHYFPI